MIRNFENSLITCENLHFQAFSQNPTPCSIPNAVKEQQNLTWTAPKIGEIGDIGTLKSSLALNFLFAPFWSFSSSFSMGIDRLTDFFIELAMFRNYIELIFGLNRWNCLQRVVSSELVWTGFCLTVKLLNCKTEKLHCKFIQFRFLRWKKPVQTLTDNTVKPMIILCSA